MSQSKNVAHALRLIPNVLSLAIVLGFAQNAFAETATASTDDQFTQGMSAREAGDFEASIKAFQDLLSAEPSLSRVRAELAVSYFKALNFAAAKEQAEQILNDPKTPEPVKINVQKFVDYMAKESQTHVFTPYVNFGYGHDDNINVGPSSNIINIGGAQLVAGASKQTSNHTMLNAGLAHRYLSPKTFNVFGRTAAFIWQSNASYYQNNYSSSNPYDLDVLSVSTGPMLAVANRWRAGVDFSLDHILLGHNKLADFYGITPSATWNLNAVTDISANTKYQRREFDNNVAPGRNSDYVSAGVDIIRKLPKQNLTFQVGANVFNENADVSRFSNDGYQITAGANFKFKDVNNVYTRYSFKNSEFDGVEPIFNQARNEDEKRMTFGYNHRFTQAKIKDWTMDLSYTHTENDANLAIYQYHRNQYALNFGKQF